jgi:hypothetical protein
MKARRIEIMNGELHELYATEIINGLWKVFYYKNAYINGPRIFNTCVDIVDDDELSLIIDMTKKKIG